MERVLSDGVTGGQAQCFIDLAAIREDLAYSASLPSLHGLPRPGCLARDQRRLPLAPLFQRPRRSTAARILNCRTSATSLVPTTNRFLRYRVTSQTYPIRHPRHCKVRAWQPEKDQVALISSPNQGANSRAEGPTRECCLKAVTARGPAAASRGACVPACYALRRDDRRTRWRRITPARARRASFTSRAPGNTAATSGSRVTTMLPLA